MLKIFTINEVKIRFYEYQNENKHPHRADQNLV